MLCTNFEAPNKITHNTYKQVLELNCGDSIACLSLTIIYYQVDADEEATRKQFLHDDGTPVKAPALVIDDGADGYFHGEGRIQRPQNTKPQCQQWR